MQSIMFARTEN